MSDRVNYLRKSMTALILSLLSGAALGSDWDIGENLQHSLGLRAGYGNEFTRGADLNLMLPQMYQLWVDYLQTDVDLGTSSETFDRYQVGLSSDRLADWSVSIDYTYSGNGNTLETSDIGLGLQYYPGRWLLEARYLFGEAEIFARQEAIDAGFVARDSVDMDRDAVELTFQYFHGNWAWSISGINYDYSRTININPDSLRSRIVLSDGSLQQLFGLLDWYVAADAGFQSGAHYWQLGYASYALEVSGNEGQNPYASWDFRFNDALSFGLLAAIGLEDSDHYGEASLRYHF